MKIVRWRSAGLKISPRKDDLKINPVSLLDDIKDWGWEKGVNLRIKGNSCEIQKLLLSMVGWFCLFLNVSVSLKMKQDTKKKQKEQHQRQIFILDSFSFQRKTYSWKKTSPGLRSSSFLSPGRLMSALGHKRLIRCTFGNKKLKAEKQIWCLDHKKNWSLTVAKLSWNFCSQFSDYHTGSSLAPRHVLNGHWRPHNALGQATSISLLTLFSRQTEFPFV